MRHRIDLDFLGVAVVELEYGDTPLSMMPTLLKRSQVAIAFPSISRKFHVASSSRIEKVMVRYY